MMMRTFVLVGCVALVFAARGTCDPAFQRKNCDFKNRQYEHSNATSAGDCCTQCSKYSSATMKKCTFWTYSATVSTCNAFSTSFTVRVFFAGWVLLVEI